MADGRERLGNSTAAFLAYTRTLRNKQKADSLNSIPPSKSLNSPPHTTNRMVRTLRTVMSSPKTYSLAFTARLSLSISNTLYTQSRDPNLPFAAHWVI
ncbi:hypothetical protein IG631_19339 [Alternaria alternata]|nr:hypothetical protein IG631_19339 [Alternaria alternata]